MAQKNNLQFTIRDYRPTDQHEVASLFRDGIIEHVYPAFFRAMSHPDHVGIALSVSMAGYVLGGSSYFQGLLFGSAWAALIYYSCFDIYDAYRIRRLHTDMADISANYLENPDNGFWVAEADVGGRGKVLGMVAVMGKRTEEEGEKFDDWNGGVIEGGSEFGEDGGYGELCHVVVSFPSRRRNVGTELVRKAMDFCKERGLGRLTLDVSSPQKAAIAVYKKLGFVQTASHSNTHTNRFISKLARITVTRMEKVL